MKLNCPSQAVYVYCDIARLNKVTISEGNDLRSAAEF